MSSPTTRTLVRANSYFDSVVLMRIAGLLNAGDGVTASLVMGTDANKAVLASAALRTPEAEAAGPNDLVIAVRGPEDELDALLARAVAELGAGVPTESGPIASRPRTLVEAVGAPGDANLALISTPGGYAAAEAMKALRLGLHVFLFSDNVALEDEVELKAQALRRGLLVMGPDCGTAIVQGIPLGFANAVRAGDIGLIGASGTGLQQVSCLIDAAGGGVTQVIGVGSHDLSVEVGGASMTAALDVLAGDAATRVLVLVSKPPAPAVADAVLKRAARAGKPVVACFLGLRGPSPSPSVHMAGTLEDAAAMAISLSRGTGAPRWAAPDASAILGGLGPERRWVRALYSGGTFAYEACIALEGAETSIGASASGAPVLLPGHLVLDLGDDEFTVARPHPMIDPSLRVEYVRRAVSAPDTAAVVLDVVLGHGAAADPAGPLAEAVVESRRGSDGGPLCIAFVCGTDADPQGRRRQESILESAGAVVVPSSTAAARLAAAVAESRKEGARR